MKKSYEKVEVEIVEIPAEDVICTSPNAGNGGNIEGGDEGFID